MTKNTEYGQYNLLGKSGNILQSSQSNHKENVPKFRWFLTSKILKNPD